MIESNKIPYSILLKESLIEIGKLKAYIDELEFKIASLEKVTKTERKELIWCNEMTELRKRNNSLRYDVKRLIAKIPK